jgi:hypothetical protein
VSARLTVERIENVSSEVKGRFIRWFSAQDMIEVEVRRLSDLIEADTDDAQCIADALVEDGTFTVRPKARCTNEECAQYIEDSSVAEGRCGCCECELSEFPPEDALVYTRRDSRARDVGWVIALHGIRSRGPWQEELQWLLGQMYGRTVPFRNWKYGRISIRVVVPHLRRRLTAKFTREVRARREQLRTRHPEIAFRPPDVIAHSFGTWIVAHALQEDESLQLGRLILVGSIIRPDWDWSPYIERGQVSAVLNYAAGQDWVVRLAAPVISDAGPSGYIGFTGRQDSVENILSPAGGHGFAFEEERLEVVWEKYWQPFLTDRADRIELDGHVRMAPAVWRPAPRPLRPPAPLLALVVFVAVVLAAALQ